MNRGCHFLGGLLLAAAAAAQPGFDVASIDSTVNPCENFYQYACGGWIAENPIPADQSRWSRFNELSERNQTILRGILEQVADGGNQRSPAEQRIGDYYASCMDEEQINSLGAKPLAPSLERIREISNPEELPALVAQLHRFGVSTLFRFGSDADFKNSTTMIADIDQGGLGLPDRDYYVRQDEKSAELRDKYIRHVQAMFQLLGESEETAARKASIVMGIETALAEGSLELVERREPTNIYHKMTTEELAKLAPSFDWKAYFIEVGAPQFDSLNVAVPQFAERLGHEIRSRSLDEWKTYLTWHLVRASAPMLSEAFLSESFDFYGRTLTGAEQIRPRWKRCVSYVDADLGEDLGKKYVEQEFPPESRERMQQMVAALESALESDIRQLEWMTPATKERALEKLDAITDKIGHPEQWRDYSGVKIVRGDALGNSLRASAAESEYQLAKIGRPVDKNEWQMTPPTVNAYYHPLENNINFPAGILQPPFFDPRLDDAVNFGGIGAVIGHELTHGFDDEGRKFSASGNLDDWWSAGDATEFEKRAQCFVGQYAGYTAVDDVKVNGNLTLGENVADNGGLRIALMALMSLSGDREPEKIDEYTPQQRLFLGWGQVWCGNIRDEAARLRVTTDPHALGRHRVNGVVSNMPEFQEAFACQAGDTMVREDACRVW